MMSKFVSGLRGVASLNPARSITLIVALAAAGCSADVTRFDSSSFAFDDPPETASIDSETPSNVYDAPVVRNAPPGPYGAGAGSVSAEPLDPPPMAEASPEPASAPYQPSYEAKPFRTAAASVPQPYAAAPSAPERGEMIEVQRGDTLYGLSRRHRVSLNELMSVNGLTSPDLRPGQKLYLPGGAGATGDAVASTPAAYTPAETPTASVAPTLDAATVDSYNTSYTVKPGDSLYAIARQHGVKTKELQAVNAITDPRRLRPGTVIRVPGSAATALERREPSPDVPPQAETQVATLNTSESVSDAPSVIAPAPAALPQAEPVEEVAAAPQTPVRDGIEQSVTQSKLRWPVTGKIIAGFGGRPDGTHNDGINFDVPLGTDVHAAESGVVAYAGSELKGYGNLVLIRHENGWVTAYAHNDELLVKRGDKVRRGQIIGKAGKTGSVDRPQVHFELRQGSKPVDPTQHMEPI